MAVLLNQELVSLRRVKVTLSISDLQINGKKWILKMHVVYTFTNNFVYLSYEKLILLLEISYIIMGILQSDVFFSYQNTCIFKFR